MTRTNITLILSSLILSTSCSMKLGVDDDCSNGNCENLPGVEDGADKPCSELILDKTGNSLKDSDIMGLKDGIAEIILSGGDARCPMSVPDIIEKLVDNGCESVGTQMVSERSQPLGVFTDYRLVTDLFCPDQQGASRKVYLHFPVHAKDVNKLVEDESGNPIVRNNDFVMVQPTEIDPKRVNERLKKTFPAIIAQDSDGVFNYYQSKNRGPHVCAPINTVPGPDAPSCDRSSDCEEGLQCVEGKDAKAFISDFRYFGSSVDYLSQKNREPILAQLADVLPDNGTTDEVDVDHTLEINQNCAGCHPNGGVLIREFDSPWVHWEHNFASPKTDELREAAVTEDGLEYLGIFRDGASLENATRVENEEWNTVRIPKVLEIMARESGSERSLTTGDLLRPLMCTDEFHIGNVVGRRGGSINSLKVGRAIIDRAFGRLNSVSVNEVTVKSEIENAGWFLAGFFAAPLADLIAFLKSVNPDFDLELRPRETIGGVTFLQRSQIDLDYQEKLDDAGIVKAKLRNALLSIDFTRAIFSEERCGLIPTMNLVDPSVYVDSSGNLKEDADQLLVDAIIGVLQNKDRSNTEDELLAKLQRVEPVDLEAMGDSFSAGCAEQDPDTFTVNYIRYLTNVRHRVAGIAAENLDASFIQMRFPGANGFLLPQALEVEEIPVDVPVINPQTGEPTGETREVIRTRPTGIRGFEPGLRFNADCSMD